MSTSNKEYSKQELIDAIKLEQNKESNIGYNAEQLEATAESIFQFAEDTPQQDVPNWDRSAGFQVEEKQWWQWSGLPLTSMAFSFFALVMVLFKVEIVVQPEGVMLSFAGQSKNSQEQKLVALIDHKLKAFASEQQVLLANYTADQAVKQQDNNLQLASYIMSTSRQERKEDFGDFVKHINAQRKDEKLDQALKFKQLEQAIFYQTTNNKSEPIIDNLSQQKQSESWTSEE